jgi:hypothetical protein
MVTFVSALYLPSGPINKPVDTYFSLFERLAGTGVPLIIYVDNRLSDRAEGLRLRFPNILECVPSVLDRSLMVRDVILPSVRNYDKDTADYMCIQLTKLRLMAEVARKNLGVLAWIDFGIYHMFKDWDRCDTLLRTVANSEFVGERILSPGYKNVFINLFEHICWKHCGSLLVGKGSAFINAYERQTALVHKHMPRLTWEVNYWAMMDECFEIYIANHNDHILERLVEDIKKSL